MTIFVFRVVDRDTCVGAYFGRSMFGCVTNNDVTQIKGQSRSRADQFALLVQDFCHASADDAVTKKRYADGFAHLRAIYEWGRRLSTKGHEGTRMNGKAKQRSIFSIRVYSCSFSDKN